MEKHVTLLGALFIAYHILGLIAGFIIMGLLSSIGCLSGDVQAMTILSTVGVVIGSFLILLSIPGLVAGIFLLKRAPWSRVLALIVGALDLIDIPFGTALGVYCFWVLLNDGTIEVFEGKKAVVAETSAG